MARKETGMTVGQRLIFLRGDRTQEDVAKELEISLIALAKYERDERTPRDEIKVKIARYYQTSVQDIFYHDKKAKGIRNIKEYAEKGRKRITRRYDLGLVEAYSLRKMTDEGIDGVWDALITAYHAGFEAGYRQTTRKMKGAQG